jgi:retron-type reverse transcriptase
MNSQLLYIKEKYDEFLKAYYACKTCIDCEMCDKAEIISDELMTLINKCNIESLSPEERKEMKNIIFSLSSLNKELKKAFT